MKNLAVIYQNIFAKGEALQEIDYNSLTICPIIIKLST